jgi:acetyltransferase-like isoleucine patch superfamily enzyme
MINILKKIVRSICRIYKNIRIKFFLLPFKEKGSNVRIHFPLKIEGKHNVSIGNNSGIGTFCHIWGAGGVKIGNDVMIAAHCCITSQGHDISSEKLCEKIICKKIVIEDDVWLGYNVIVLPGVTIGKGSVIGAGSVVTSNIPPYSIAVGNPARVIKKRESKNNE